MIMLQMSPQDLATMLTVRGINGRMRALYGAFEPAQRTEGGCQCAQLWSYKDSQDRTVYVEGQCVNPEGAHAQPWCQYEPESCTASKSQRYSSMSMQLLKCLLALECLTCVLELILSPGHTRS
jgi:hypothetical protein